MKVNLFFGGVLTAGKLEQAIGWTLLHSLWQGLLLAVAAGAVILATRRTKPAVRYNLFGLLLLVFMTGCLVTFAHEITMPKISNPIIPPTTNGFLTNLFLLKLLENWFYQFSDYFSTQAPFIVLVWMSIFSYKSIRLGGALIFNKRIRKRTVYAPSQAWMNRIEILSRQLQLKKKITLLESGMAKIPLVIGHFKPVILIPLGLLSSLPPERVEAVLLHELAHIRRSDYLVNILQHVMESLFFFNPGLLWISGLLREERENCCDDIALAQTNNKKEFIEALVSFKEYALASASITTAFPGNKNQLLHRVTRIIKHRNKTLNNPEKIFFTLNFVLLGSLLLFSATGNLLPPVTARPADEVEQPLNLSSMPRRTVLLSQTEQTPNNASQSKVLPTRKKQVVIHNYRMVITNDQIENMAAVSREVKESEETISADAKQAIADRQQADEDRMQADEDRKQAGLDREQAIKDQKQSEVEREQFKKDRIQFEKDRQVSEADAALTSKKKVVVL